METKPIPGLPGYFVTRKGDVYSASLTRTSSPGVMLPLKTWKMRNGYLKFVPRLNGKQVNFLVHRAVALAWLGDPGKGFEVCHNDGVRVHNDASNLRWDTRKANAGDRLAHGTDARGHKAYQVKLTIEQVKIIIETYEGRTSVAWGLTRLAKEFGVHPSTVNDVARRRTWMWVAPVKQEQTA